MVSEPLRRAHRGLCEMSSTLLMRFIRLGALETMRQEAAELEADAVNVDFPCFGDIDDNRPADHLRRRAIFGRNGIVRGDRFERSGVICRLLRDGDLTAFVSGCLEVAPLRTGQDPYRWRECQRRATWQYVPLAIRHQRLHGVHRPTGG